MNEREIFVAARALADPEQRSAFLASVCGDDDLTKRRLVELLAADVQDDFLQVSETRSIESIPTECPGQTIGPYKLLERIGEGGFGTVFMAEQTAPVRRTVALKVIKAGMDSRQVIARFEAERQALAIMDHPHIAKVLDAGTTEAGRPYFVMELVKGIPVNQFCDDRRASLSERLKLFVSVCQAIQHAHSKGVIHRDIKPGNVLVAMYDNRPVPKVIDFGVAKATGQQLTQRTLHTGFGAIVGSLEYMSPEQASFNQLDIDTRSDVYSLGVLLYELLTGTTPFALNELQEAGLLESLRIVREAEPRRPSVRLSTSESLPWLAASRSVEPSRLTAIVRGELDWIVMKALEKDRNRRYETVSSLSEEIESFLRGEPVAAHPPSALYRLRKWAVRHASAVSAAVAMLLLVASIVFLSFRSWHLRSDQIATHSARVTTATGKVSTALGAAKSAPIGQDAQWVAARTAASRLEELLLIDQVDDATRGRAEAVLGEFQHLDADRLLAEQIESVVIMSATHADRDSWERMEKQFRELFLSEGIDFKNVTSNEVAQQIREHRSAEQLCDALELWIATKGQISALGGERATRESMQPMADAMLASDDDPVRTGIRRLLYRGKQPTMADVDAVVDNVELTSLTPRTLSWLASVYGMAGAVERGHDVFYDAVDWYPSDFMLNFDFAYTLESNQCWPEAIRYFLRCTALRPDVSGVWRGLGNAYRENGELKRAQAALTRAIQLSPEHSSIYVDLARTQISLEKFLDAESSARKAIELGNKLPMAQFCLGQSLMHQAKYAESMVAFAECDRLNQADPRHAVATEEAVAECRQKLSESLSHESGT